LAARTAVSNCSPIESSSSTVGDAFQRAQTQLVLDRIPVLEKDINDANAAFEAIIGKELAGVNAKLTGKKVDAIKVMTKEEYDKKQQDK
jgi:hypothetical protein